MTTLSAPNLPDLQLNSLQIMGVLNVSPDSFSDGGYYNNSAAALAHASNLIAQGASIIDIGGEATNPNAPAISVAQELQRVLPVVQAIRAAHPHMWLSIDTSSPEVFAAAHQAGANIWNDVRALTAPTALSVAAALQVPVILMHMRGSPTTMDQLANYNDCVNEVYSELEQRVNSALAAGVHKHNIVIDLGFGFAKQFAHNLALLRKLDHFKAIGLPMLMGISRKRFMGDLLGGHQLHAADSRLHASLAASCYAYSQGVRLFRTHDVAATKQALHSFAQLV